jgi:hypothetical protein
MKKNTKGKIDQYNDLISTVQVTFKKLVGDQLNREKISKE